MRTKLTGTVIGMMVAGIAAMGHAQEWNWWRSFQEETRQEERVRAPEPTIIDLREVPAETPAAEVPSRVIEEVTETPQMQQRVIEIQSSILPSAAVADPVDSEVSLPYDELGGMYILYTDSDDQAAFDEMVLGSVVFQADVASHMAASYGVEVAVQKAVSVAEIVNAVYQSNFDSLVASAMMETMLMEQEMQEAAMKQMMKNSDQFQEVLKPNATMFKTMIGGVVNALKDKLNKKKDGPEKKESEWDGMGAGGSPGGALPWEQKKTDDKTVASASLNAPSCVFSGSSPASAGGMGVPKTGGAGFAGTSTGPDGGGAFGVGKSGEVVKQAGKNIPKDACPQMGKQGQIGKGTPVMINAPTVADKWGRHNSLADLVVMICKEKYGVKHTIGMLTGSPERKMNELLKSPEGKKPGPVQDMANAAKQQMGKLPEGSAPYPTVGKAMDAHGANPNKPLDQQNPTQDNKGEGKTIKVGEQKKSSNPNPLDDGGNELKADKCDQHKMQIANCFDELTAGQTEKSLAEKSLFCQKMTLWADPKTPDNPCADDKSKASGFDFNEFMYGNSQGAGAGAGGPDDK